jgi:glutamate dehydrogenase (NAD(P)+)
MSAAELQRMTRRFANGIHHVIGPYRDIAAPDMNTNAQTMAWMMDAYSAHHGYTPAIVTGKPVDLGGAPGREAATGRGVVDVLEAHAERQGLVLAGLRLAIQGFGNVGSWVAREAAARGCVVVAVSDVHGGVRHDAGLDVAALVEVVAARGAVGDTPQPGVVRIENDELLTGPCDVLVPAALGQVIGGDNATEVQASVVLEAANYPVTPDGDKVLGDRGITVVPDVLANAGGVTGSYFEWSQNIQQFRWKEERFNAELRDRMRLAYHATADTAADLGCTLRQAAFAIGMRRVAHASRLRGYV